MKSRRGGLSLPKKKAPVRSSLIAIGILAVLVAIIVYFTQDTTTTAPTSKSIQESAKKSEADIDQPSESERKVVPATQPIALTISEVGVQSAPIIPVGIDTNGEMVAPGTNHEVGWYDQSATPAETGGALLLDGHVGLEGQSAVFKELHRLRTGSVIKVTAQDGSVYSYEVYHVEQMPLEDVDMRKMMRSVNPSKQGLNIITCAGDYDASRSTYDDRVLVYAVRV